MDRDHNSPPMNYRVGITGNYYYTSTNRSELEQVCTLIDKAKSSIYWNAKYKVFAIRIKSKHHKTKAKQLGRLAE